ncbi:MAG: hypothetical protein ACAH59_08645 [Pseudobdellovibrionaceae bacterium]
MKLIYGDLLDQAWKALKDNLALVAGLTAVYLVGIWVISHIPIVGALLVAPMGLGYFKCLLLLRKKEVIGFQDFFWAYTDLNRLLHALLMNVLVYIGCFVGFILLIIPGVWFSVASIFSSALFVTEKQDAVEVIKRSLELVRGRWWNIFGFMILLTLLNVAGGLCLMVGLLLTFPVSCLAIVMAAEKLSAHTPITPLKPPEAAFKESSADAKVTVLPQ